MVEKVGQGYIRSAERRSQQDFGFHFAPIQWETPLHPSRREETGEMKHLISNKASLRTSRDTPGQERWVIDKAIKNL